MTPLNVKILKKIVTDASGKFWTGSVQFMSEDCDDWPEGMSVPTVNLSRSGTNPKCDTPVTALQAHNGHAPGFKSAEEMDDYIARVMQHVIEAVAPVQLPDNLKADLEDIDGLDKI